MTLLLLSGAARADEAEDRSKALVGTFIDECMTARAGLSRNAVRSNEAIAASLRKAVDIPAVAETLLGRWWKKMSADQQARFVGLFDRYVMATFNFDDINRQIAYQGYGRNGERLVVVTYIADPAGGEPTRFDWVTSGGPAPRIVDVVVDGQSIAKTVKEDFTSALRANGGDIEGFLRLLTDKIKAMNDG
jgi:phospholipid transport system substrate-binding protein